MLRNKPVRHLDLWMNGLHVGSWQLQNGGGETLQYSEEWTRSAQGRPLSLSLPFVPGNRPHRGAPVHNYFENLLPDSKLIRERVARRFKMGSSDAFHLLSEIGRDCVGALQIMPAGESPGNIHTIDAAPMSPAEVAQALRHTLGSGAMGSDHAENDDEFRISIAGAQEKTAFLRRDDQWCRPHGATPTTHIFKMPLGLIGNMQVDMRDSVENEWLCSQIIHAYGLPVARTEILQFEDMKVLAVERFDRRWSPDSRWLLRLPQEDMCQATNTPPLLKYESDGGPGIDAIMKLLETSVQAEQDRRTFFKAQVLFWMLRATDGHAKNFSLFLQPGGAFRLTPLYDILSAHPVIGTGANQLSPYKVKMAMAVRSKNPHWVMRHIHRRHWVAIGQRYGITHPDGGRVEDLLDELVAETPEVIRRMRTLLPAGFPPAVADPILHGLNATAGQLAT